MQFRSAIHIDSFPFKISHKSRVFLIGSCFSENISKKLKERKYKSLANPFGISYNPHSIQKLLLRDKPFQKVEFIQSDELYFHYDLHSELSSTSLDALLLECNKRLDQQKSFLNNSDILFISFGTSFVYRLASGNKIVNNCHKQTASLFTKQMMGKEDIVQEWKTCLANLKRHYPNIKHFVFTLSPVRHLKDGIVANQLSKANLRVVIEEICQEDQQCHYFPSYEIMMDDLRDYRFYKKDLIHPSDLALDYIWEKFSEVFFSKEESVLNREIEKIKQALDHKAFHPSSQNHQQFLNKLIKRIELLQQNNELDFEAEIITLKKQLLS